MTRTGEMRERYSQEVEPRPSRFIDPGAYREWADRADAWTREQDYQAASRGDVKAAKHLPMSEWAEERRPWMTPQTIAANWRLNRGEG